MQSGGWPRLAIYRRRKPVSDAFGSAKFAYDKLLASLGLLSDRGLVIGRTLSGALIRLPSYCHGLLVGGPGSGKSTGFMAVNLLSYAGTVIVFDPKSDLYRATAAWRKA